MLIPWTHPLRGELEADGAHERLSGWPALYTGQAGMRKGGDPIRPQPQRDNRGRS